MLISTEFNCALEEYILLTAFLDLIISLANIVQTSLCPFFAASLRDLLAFSSSLWMAAKTINASCFQKQFPMVKFSGEWLGIPHWHFLHIKFKKDQVCTNLWFVCQEHDLLSSSLCTILVPVHCKKTKLHCVLTLIFEPVTSRFIHFFLTNFFLPCFGSW